MKRFKFTKALALTMGAAMSLTAFAGLSGCGAKTDALVLMSDELNNLFSPFYSTAGSDMDVMGQTQIGMYTTDENGELAYGENEACVALDFKSEKIEEGTNTYTDYYFVLKNNLKFSDGVPLTMNDVLFNLYTLLDPTYAGSSTMYSTDIVGLKDYRTQSKTSGNNTSAEDNLTQSANTHAKARRNEIVAAFREIGRGVTDGNYSASPDKMRSELSNSNSSAYPTIAKGYLDAIGVTSQDQARAQMLADYNHVAGDPNGKNDDAKKGLFRNELETDFKSAKDSYQQEPYDTAKLTYNGQSVGTGFNDITSFLLYEGYAHIEYNQTEGGIPNRNSIKEVTLDVDPASLKSQDDAIEMVYQDKITRNFDQIMNFWASGTTMFNEFVSKAKEVILNASRVGDELIVPNITGIVSLGHTGQEATVNVGGKEYKVAHQHNEQGVPSNSDEYDVLRIRINGLDPKAVWNFGFSVAPYHYYSDTEKYPVDIANNKFGVDFAKFEFQTGVIQGTNKNGDSKNGVPVGAGPYMATDEKGETDLPASQRFISGNIVYYKANPNFMFPVVTEKLQYCVVPSSNALGTLEDGDVHFVTPQFTKKNSEEVVSDKFLKSGFKYLSAWQLGYGYIGINAGKVTDINLRRAIMAAMDTQLATTYYSSGSAVNIEWPMSTVSWAYPRTDGNSYNGANPTANMKKQSNSNLTYASTIGWSQEDRKKAIEGYMQLANVKANDPKLRIKFTIAGADLMEHPCYNTMHDAMNLLNECGWDVSISSDPNALIKLSTGSLEVWAAAWGSSLDPDMYQIYHKNSTATSILAWGYREILGDSSRTEENRIITDLSKLIEDARRIDDKGERTRIYEDAMKKILELAVELPVYQRKTLYAYNYKVIDEDTLQKDAEGKPLINSYASPLNRIWEVGLLTE